MKNTSLLLATAAALALLAACRSTPSSSPAASAAAPTLPGPMPDGAVLLPNQWSLRPVGKHVVLGDFPVNIALHPGGKFAAVLHSGYGQHEIVVVDIARAAITTRVPLPETFYGLAFTADGRQLLCSGAGDEVLHQLAFVDGFLSAPRSIVTGPKSVRGVPAGIAIAPDGHAWTANVWGHSLAIVDLASTNRVTIRLGTNDAVAATGTPAASEDEAAITKRAEAALDATTSADPFPYAVALDAKRGRAYVSLWAQSAVAVLDLKTRAPLARWATGQHPNELLLNKAGTILFVANANHNTVSLLDTATGVPIETLVAELLPNSPPGSTPNSLALSPDEKLLFVANANINAVAVFDVSAPGRSRSLGFIPVGWYPTSARVTADGKKLLVANGKGQFPKANRHGPQPGRATNTREYIAGILQGTMSVIDLPVADKLEAQMKEWTARTLSCMPEAVRAPRKIEAGNPVPEKVGGASPIRYVLYVIKENRTYDQVLGDMKEGNGDPSLCLFPERITPNHHALAREFVLLDNFYVESEVSADGHEWTMGAYATDFVEKNWPLSYGHNSSKKFPYPSEGGLAVAAPAGGYLWDRAKEAGVTYRSYGEFVSNGKTTNAPGTTRQAALKGNFDPWFRSFDMDYPDVQRAARFLSELRRFEREGEMPRLQIIRLPNDHTSGTSAGKHTPTAAMADNDLAFGQVVEAVSKSKFWPQTAIFVVEDDAQNGPDHVDAHRTVAYVISPWTKRGSVDSTLYSTASMLRTMELILGLKPMSQFDAAAMPMHACFGPRADTRPYTARPAGVDLNARNPKNAPGAKLSAKFDFTKEDAADDIQLNRVIWQSVKGANSEMPAPVRAGYVIVRKHGGDDDD